MKRPLLPSLLLIAFLFTSCAGDKEEKKNSSAAPVTPMDTLATPKEMVPVEVPLPVRKPTPPAEEPSPGEQKPEEPAPEESSPEEPAPEEPSPEEPAPQEPKPLPPRRPNPQPQPDQNPTWDESFRAAQERAKNAQLSCEGGRCHPSVGLLTIVNKETNGWGVGQCTASLVSSDVVVTNGHCIPMDLKESGASCRGRLWLTFGSESGLDKQIGCSEILYRHKDSTLDGSDYAYFRLDRRSNRPTLRQSREGFEHNKNYFLHKINPVRSFDGVAGHMEKVSCLSLYNTAIFEQPLNRQSHSSFLVDCLVVPGNSGAPILAEDGSIRGVIYAFIKPEKVQLMLNRNGSLLPSSKEMSPLNVGSNFACLKLPENLAGQPLPKACEGHAARLQAAKREAEARLVARLKPQAQRIIEAKQGSRIDIRAFGWTVRTSSSPNTGRVALGYPECVSRENSRELLGQKMSTHRPFFYIKAKYNRYAIAAQETLVWAGFADSVETVSLSRVEGKYRVQITDPASGQQEMNAALGLCGK